MAPKRSPAPASALGGGNGRAAQRQARRAVRKQAQAALGGGARTGRRPKSKAERPPSEKHAAASAPVTAGPRPPPPQDTDTRFAFFEGARDHTPYLGVETDGGRFIVAASDRGVGRSLFVKRGRPELRVLRHAVTVIEILSGADAIGGRLFVDVGANIGTTTIPALVSHRFGSVVACEPGEESYRLLRANLALNGLETHVRPLRVAASNRVGRSSFVLTEGRSGASWIATSPEKVEAAEAARAKRVTEDPAALTDPLPRAPDEVAEMKVVEVELVTLDQLAEGGVIDRDGLGMLWIDAEGHEGHILDGAGTLAERGVPIVFEFNPAGLDERGDRDKVHAVAECFYTHFVDVRRAEADPTQPRFRLRSVAELPGYAERFLDSATPGHFTDLLLLRLDAAQARVGVNLPELMSQEEPPRARQRNQSRAKPGRRAKGEGRAKQAGAARRKARRRPASEDDPPSGEE